MATVVEDLAVEEYREDRLSGMPRAHAVDRWIFVAMATWFIGIVLVGFVPDSMAKMDMVGAGTRAPFPLVLHIHAMLMGSFLLLVLAQTVMVATGRAELHRHVGVAAFALVPALVIVGVILAPTMYYQVWEGAHAGPPQVRAALTPVVSLIENILLLQISSGVLFAILMAIALSTRTTHSGLHKRMVFLATSVPLGAAIDRVSWLPSSMPVSPWTTYVYILAALAPLVVWDVVRHQRVHRAYSVFLCVFVPAAALVVAAWDKPWWHAAAHTIMRV